MISVSKRDSNSLSIEFVDSKSLENQSVVVDHAVVASGHNNSKKFPMFVGFENCKGWSSHSINYKNCTNLDLFNKRVLVVGMSYSAVDVASDVSISGNNKVTLLTRKGNWFSPIKCPRSGIPSDIKLPRIFTYLPYQLQNNILMKSMANHIDYKKLGIPNNCEPAGGCIVSSERLINLVKNNNVDVIHGCISNRNFGI